MSLKPVKNQKINQLAAFGYSNILMLPKIYLNLHTTIRIYVVKSVEKPLRYFGKERSNTGAIEIDSVSLINIKLIYMGATFNYGHIIISFNTFMIVSLNWPLCYVVLCRAF